MVKIISDSTCDLSRELIAKYNVAIIPLHILLGEEEYEDGRNISPEEIYEWSDANKTTPKTSAVGMDTALAVMKPFLDAQDELVVFCISEQMSTTGNVLRMAAQELEAEDRVSVVDSANLSTGIGLLVIEAAIMAKEGRSREEIVSRIEELKPLVRASFVVDTLTYLYRGGRCSGLAALAGGMLKLHPKIVVKDGKMGVDKKYRGKLSMAINNYVRDMEEALRAARPERVFITHSGCDGELVDEVRVNQSQYNAQAARVRVGTKPE